MRFHSFVALTAVVLGFAVAPATRAGEPGDGADALIRALSRERISLFDGIRRAESGGSAVISAKYELDGRGELMLSVYVAEQGLERDAEHNVLTELIGSPVGGKWAPKKEVFEDVPHVARSAQQLALMTLSPQSLREIVERMDKNEPVISAIPVLRGRKALVALRTLKEGAMRDHEFDLLSGAFVAPSQDGVVHVPVKRHEFVRQGEWVVEFGCAAEEKTGGSVFFRIAEAPRDVEKVLLVNERGETVVAPISKSDTGGFCEASTGVGFGTPIELWIYPRQR